MTALTEEQQGAAKWALERLEHYMQIYGHLKPDDPDWNDLAAARYELLGGMDPFAEPRGEIPGETK